MCNLIRSRLMILAGAMLLALALPAPAAEIDRLLPNDTQLVLVVNVRQILDSPLIKKHALEHFKEHLKSNEEVSKLLESLGFDPLKDLTSVTLSVSELSADAKVVAIARGQFDKTKFEAKADAVAKEKGDILKIHSEGARKVYEVQLPEAPMPGFVAVIDRSTIVASRDKDAVLQAFDRAEGKSKSSLKDGVKKLIEAADSNQSIWMVAPGSFVRDSKLAEKADDKAKASMAKIDHFSAGVTIAKGIKFAQTIRAKTDDNAKELSDEIKEGLEQAKGFLAFMAGQEPKLAPVVDLIGSMKIVTEGKSVTVKSEVSEELIEKGLKKDQ